MIKGIGFLKLLKQFCFILLISCFIGLGSFSSAGVVKPIGIYGSSVYDNSYDLNVISKGSLLTQFIGQTKNVLFLRYGDFFIWDDKGNLYTHLIRNPDDHNSSISEGYFDQVYICDELNSSSGDPTNCSLAFNNAYNNSLVISYYKDFLKTVNTSDYFYYDDYIYRSYSSVACRGLTLCISSSSVGKSFCWANSVDYGLLSCNNYSNRFPGIQSITGSVGLGDIPFGSLNGYLSPAVDGSIDGGNSSANIGTLGGNQNYIQCTLNAALQWYKYKGYSDKLCYGGLDDYSILGTDDFIPIYGQGIYLTDLYNNTKFLRAKGHTGTEMSKNEWFNYWRNLYKGYKNGMYSTNPFSDNPAVLFTYFGAVDVYGGAFDNDSILEYCKISSHNGSLSALYSGVNYNSVCNWSPISVIQDTVDGELSGSGYNDWANGDVSIGASWDGVLSGGITFTNGKTFISDTFNRLKDNFLLPVGNGGVFGVLPGYIILAMLGLILFRFLSH